MTILRFRFVNFIQFDQFFFRYDLIKTCDRGNHPSALPGMYEDTFVSLFTKVGSLP